LAGSLARQRKNWAQTSVRPSRGAGSYLGRTAVSKRLSRRGLERPCRLGGERRATPERKLLRSPTTEEEAVYARVATFEGDPSRVDDAINMVRAGVESKDTPAGLEGAKMLMLVNRETGKGLGVTLFESEEAMRRGDEALNAMNPGGTERRTSVEFFDVPVQTVR
jgi:hypothetical protein